MTPIIEKISRITAHLHNRIMARDLILNHIHEFENLLKFSFDLNNKKQDKGCWTIEMIALKDSSMVFPQLDFILNNYQNLFLESARRPISKTLMIVTKKEYRNLTQEQKEMIATVCMDFVMNNEKVATQAYAIETLIKLRNDIDWIKVDLLVFIEKNAPLQTTGYKSVAKKAFKFFAN
jgi:hypothetical protein